MKTASCAVQFTHLLMMRYWASVNVWFSEVKMNLLCRQRQANTIHWAKTSFYARLHAVCFTVTIRLLQQQPPHVMSCQELTTCHSLCLCCSLSHNKITDASADRLLQLASINPSIHTVRWADRLHAFTDRNHLRWLHTHYCGWVSDVCSFCWSSSRLFNNNIADRTRFERDRHFEIWWTSRQCGGDVLIRDQLMFNDHYMQVLRSTSTHTVLQFTTWWHQDLCVVLLYGAHIYNSLLGSGFNYFHSGK